MVSLLADFFNNIINALFRNISPTVRGIVVLVFIIIAFFLLSKSIRLKSKGGETNPLHIGFLLTSLLCFGLGIMYAIIL